MNIPSTLFFTHAAFRRNPGFRGIARRKSSHRRRTFTQRETLRIGRTPTEAERPMTPRLVIGLHRFAPFAIEQRIDRTINIGTPQKIGIATHLTTDISDVQHLRHHQYEQQRHKGDTRHAEPLATNRPYVGRIRFGEELSDHNRRL